MTLGGFQTNSAQRIITHETDKSQSELPVTNAWIGALSADVVILGAMLIGAIVGWASILMVGVVLAERLGVYVHGAGRRGGLTQDQAQSRAMSISGLVVIVAAALSYPAGRYIHTGARAAWFAVSVWLAPLLVIPWAVWFALAGCVIVALFWERRKRAILGAIGIGIVVFCVWYAQGQARASLENTKIAISRLRWFVVPLLLPWIGYAMPLSVRMALETMFGSMWPPVLEREKLSEVGFAGMFGKSRTEGAARVVKEIEPGMLVNVRTSPENGESKPVDKLGTVPRPAANVWAFYDYALAILAGDATFSERGSRKGAKDPKTGAIAFEYTEVEWAALKAACLSLGLATENRDGSASLSTSGLAYLAGQVARHFGPEVVPEVYTPLLGNTVLLDENGRAP